VSTDLDRFLVERRRDRANAHVTPYGSTSSEEEQVKLALLIVAINGWNRIQVGSRAVHPVGEQRAAYAGDGRARRRGPQLITCLALAVAALLVACRTRSPSASSHSPPM